MGVLVAATLHRTLSSRNEELLDSYTYAEIAPPPFA